MCQLVASLPEILFGISDQMLSNAFWSLISAEKLYQDTIKMQQHDLESRQQQQQQEEEEEKQCASVASPTLVAEPQAESPLKAQLARLQGALSSRQQC